MTIKILLADDHRVVRQGLRMFLSLDPDLVVIAEAANGAEAVRLAEQHLPDVVLMDLVMPVMDGLEATIEIRRRGLAAQVVILTSILEASTVTAVLRAGAMGYLLKNTEDEELRQVIKGAAAGRVQLSPEVASRLLVETARVGDSGELTEREAEVLRLTAQGLSDQDIADRLVLPEPALHAYIQDLLDRLRQATRDRQGLDDDLALARQIQLSLLPATCPRRPGWDFTATYRPAWHVGGDLYDFFDDHAMPELGLLIADVSGKGTSAALFMAHARSMIRSSLLADHRPARTLARANALIRQNNRTDQFVSALYGRLNCSSGRFTYANAGHNWPLHWRAATRDFQELSSHGVVLGVLEQIEPEEKQVDLAPGDLLILYTDGITEAASSGGELFGIERLTAAVRGAVGGSADRVMAAILDDVLGFSSGAPQADDFTLVVLRRGDNDDTNSTG